MAGGQTGHPQPPRAQQGQLGPHPFLVSVACVRRPRGPEPQKLPGELGRGLVRIALPRASAQPEYAEEMAVHPKGTQLPHIHVHTHTHLCTCVHRSTHEHICAHVCTHTCTPCKALCAHMFTHVCMYLYVCTHSNTQAHMCVHMYIHSSLLIPPHPH